VKIHIKQGNQGIAAYLKGVAGGKNSGPRCHMVDIMLAFQHISE
jgi:hypothetical protein